MHNVHYTYHCALHYTVCTHLIYAMNILTYNENEKQIELCLLNHIQIKIEMICDQLVDVACITILLTGYLTRCRRWEPKTGVGGAAQKSRPRSGSIDVQNRTSYLIGLIEDADELSGINRLDKSLCDAYMKHMVLATLETRMFKVLAILAVALSFATPALAVSKPVQPQERCIGPYDSAKDFWYDQKLCQ